MSLWLGSWGSDAGLRRVVRRGDGWLASAYNTDPAQFARARSVLDTSGSAAVGPDGTFPHALVTMWTWVTDRPEEAEHQLSDVVARVVRRDPRTLPGRLCIGSAETCAELLSSYAAAGCRRVHFWPLGDERRQLERPARHG